MTATRRSSGATSRPSSVRSSGSAASACARTSISSQMGLPCSDSVAREGHACASSSKVPTSSMQLCASASAVSGRSSCGGAAARLRSAFRLKSSARAPCSGTSAAAGAASDVRWHCTKAARPPEAVPKPRCSAAPSVNRGSDAAAGPLAAAQAAAERASSAWVLPHAGAGKRRGGDALRRCDSRGRGDAASSAGTSLRLRGSGGGLPSSEPGAMAAAPHGLGTGGGC